MDPGEFPPVAGFPKTAVLKIGRREFLRAMKQVGFAAAMDESRPVLTAVLVRKEKQGLELVATDGFRLSRVVMGESSGGGEKKEVEKRKEKEGDGEGGKKRAKFEAGGEGQWLVPVKALQEAARLIEETEGKGELEMGLTEGKNQVVFRVDGVGLSSRLVEGTFPDYEKILPESWSSRMEVEKEELVRNLKLVGVFARESANVVKLVVAKSGLKLTGESATLGKGEGEAEGKLEGDEVEVAFNYRYVLDFLSATSGNEVVLELAGPVAPGVWKSVGEEGWLHVVMPVRLQGEKTA
jgi:DNA polymerase-3 subunit beta